VLFIEYVKYLGAAVRVGASELFGTQSVQNATTEN